jgi:hypothetical protein
MQTRDYEDDGKPVIDHEAAPATNGGGDAKVNLPAPAGAKLVNPFVHFRERNSSGGFIKCDLVKLDHATGTYLRHRGEAKSVLTDEERRGVIINPDELIDTWTKWVNGELAEPRRVYQTRLGQYSPPRDELPDFDERSWPSDRRTGKSKDPWQRAVYLPMKINGEVVAFQATGVAAIGEIGDIVGMYGEADRQGKSPIVDLETRSFTSRQGGLIFVPVFRLRDWGLWGDAPADPVPPIAIPDTPPPAQRQLPPKKRSGDLDDSIPF